MNEIEKLYKLAKVKKLCNCSNCTKNYFHCADDATTGCTNLVYPEFTAEKQLELIKFCLDKYEVIGKTPDVDRCILHITSDAEDRAFVVTDYISCETWEESIAGLINNFWQDLSEEEKQQIKEILK